MDVISHPFRLAANGSVATVLDGSTDANAEAIAIIATTRRGERVLVPTFGTSDPVFDEYDLADLNACLATPTFGPDGVTVTAIDTTADTDTTVTVIIEFEE